MKYDKAIKLAIEALEQEIKRLAANANMHDMMHLDAPSCVAASERRKLLREAVVALSQRVML